MRIAIVILGVATVVGLSIFALGSKYSGKEAAVADVLPFSPATGPKDVDAARPGSPVPETGDNRAKIKARYHAAAAISSAAERDREYGALAGYAAADGDFELAVEIAAHVSAAGGRDSSYARIVHQAVMVRDFAAADKAAKKISSAALREEQFRKIVQSCPANTTAPETTSALGLQSDKQAETVTRYDRGR
jgi:hypothetical protein